jgi:hypothetical protein
MATFKFGRAIDIHWQGYEIVGPANTVFSIPDQLYEEFDADIAPVEPTLEWIDTNEFLTLQNSVSVTTLTGTSPIVVTETSAGRDISLSANYQTAGTYVTSVTGTAPITASGTTAITVGIDQAAITANSATNAEVLRTYVKNTSGSTMTKGQAVYVNGATGTNVTIQLATATSEVGSSKTLGLLAQDLTNNAFGYVIESGLIAGIDTSAATAGASVWLGDTPGSRVYNSPPAEPSHSVFLGIVARSNVNNGEILVQVQNGYELDELHDVSAASPSDGDIIQYKNSSSLWTKSSVAAAGIAASVHTHAYQDAGTYVTAVNGTAPITASTNTAGIVTVGLSASYQTAGTYVSAVNGSAPITASTDTAGIVSVSLSASYASSVHTHSTSSITSGNFAATVSGGTGVTVTGGTGNASTPSIAIGQAVATTSDVTFAKITGTGIFSAASVKIGSVTVNPVANDMTAAAVTGLSVPTTGGGAVILVTAITSANAFRSVAATNATFTGNNLTGFTVYLFRTNTTSTGVWWMVYGE